MLISSPFNRHIPSTKAVRFGLSDTSISHTEACKILAEKGADWWIEQVKKPRIDILPNSQLHHQAEAEGQQLADWAATNISVSDLEKFRQALKNAIQETLLERYRLLWTVDQEPEKLIKQATKSAELDNPEAILTALPWKSAMLIENREIRVKVGQYKPLETIFKLTDS